jgi:ribosomal protein S19
MVAGDNITVASTGTFRNAGNTANDKNVGTGKTVALTNIMAGTDLGNYTITDQLTTTADITPKALAISGITAANKVYDGTATASVSTVGVTDAVLQAGGMVAGDNITVASTGTFRNAGNTANDKNAGIGKTVALNNTMAGTDLGNYAITDQLTTTADITPKALTLSGITAVNKVYDGTATATVSTVGVTPAVLQAGGLVPGDNITVASTGAFRNAGNTVDDNNVGAMKIVALTNTVAGADVGNYTITDQLTTTADITPKPVAIAPFVPVINVPGPAVAGPPPALGPVVSATSASSNPLLASSNNIGIVVSTIRASSQQTPGIVAVLLPKGSASVGVGAVIYLPEEALQSASPSSVSVVATLPSGAPLPSWIKYVESEKGLVLGSVPEGGLPFQVMLTIGDQRTVVQISESQVNK